MLKQDKALIVGVNINNQRLFNESMVELANLAEASEMKVVGRIDQNLKAIQASHYIGSGKVRELKELIDALDVDIVIFNNELSPTQARNLENGLGCKIMDRTSLILEIFSRRAKTKEAKLQVEIALLQYVLPRLIGSNENLGRQSGGVGTRNKGGGEKKLELDRRKIRLRIALLNKALEDIRKERSTQRKQRKKTGLPLVALVGYTNAGKSTLMNAMIELTTKIEDKKVFEKNMLFATLDTAIRNITLPNHLSFLLSDTVGFVGQLPHNLVKAFRSTLEEVKEADLLLHIVDVSSPHYHQQIEVTNETLKKIGASDIPMLYVYNKADLIDMDIPTVQGEDIYISAQQRIGIELLVSLIGNKVFSTNIKCAFLIPYNQGQIVSYLNQHAKINSVSYESMGTLMTVECNSNDYLRYEQYLIKE